MRAAAGGRQLPYPEFMRRPQTLLALLAAAAAGCGGGAAGAGDGDGDVGGDGDGGDGDGDISRVESYIRGDVKAALAFEIDSVPGFEPDPVALGAVTDLLSTLLDKPAGIAAVADGELASRGADHAWSGSELRDLAAGSFDLDVDDDTAKIHVLYVDGHSDRDSENGIILGLAFGNQTLVMFKDTIERTCSSSSVPVLVRERLCRDAEQAILTHEIGHVIGLVDNGLEMVEDHRDPDHGAHDSDSECVMYFAYQGDALIDRFRDQLIGGGENTLGFDAACLADIAAVRDR